MSEVPVFTRSIVVDEGVVLISVVISSEALTILVVVSVVNFKGVVTSGVEDLIFVED